MTRTVYRMRRQLAGGGRLNIVMLTRALKAPTLAALLVGLIIVCGTTGYVLIEDWPVWDAF